MNALIFFHGVFFNRFVAVRGSCRGVRGLARPQISIYQAQNRKGCLKLTPLSVPASWNFFSNIYFRKKLIHYTFQMLLSRFEQKKFLNFLVKYSTSAHYGGHTIYSFPKSVDVLHYWIQMNILTKYGDQWMTGVPVIMLQRWHIS